MSRLCEEGHIISMPFGGSRTSLNGLRDGYWPMVFGMDIFRTGELVVQGAVEIINGRTLDRPTADPGVIIDITNIDIFGATAYGAWED